MAAQASDRRAISPSSDAPHDTGRDTRNVTVPRLSSVISTPPGGVVPRRQASLTVAIRTFVARHTELDRRLRASRIGVLSSASCRRAEHIAFAVRPAVASGPGKWGLQRVLRGAAMNLSHAEPVEPPFRGRAVIKQLARTQSQHRTGVDVLQTLADGLFGTGFQDSPPSPGLADVHPLQS